MKSFDRLIILPTISLLPARVLHKLMLTMAVIFSIAINHLPSSESLLTMAVIFAISSIHHLDPSISDPLPPTLDIDRLIAYRVLHRVE
jgi:hypothetical protein